MTEREAFIRALKLSPSSSETTPHTVMVRWEGGEARDDRELPVSAGEARVEAFFAAVERIFDSLAFRLPPLYVCFVGHRLVWVVDGKCQHWNRPMAVAAGVLPPSPDPPKVVEDDEP